MRNIGLGNREEWYLNSQTKKVEKVEWIIRYLRSNARKDRMAMEVVGTAFFYTGRIGYGGGLGLGLATVGKKKEIHGEKRRASIDTHPILSPEDILIRLFYFIIRSLAARPYGDAQQTLPPRHTFRRMVLARYHGRGR